MRTRYKATLSVLVLLAAGGSVALYKLYDMCFNVLLESKYVQYFKVEEVQGTRPTRLIISGLAFNSAMTVKRITTKTIGSVIVVSVYLALTKKGTSGSFAYELTVPDSVNEVRFGSSVAPIWKRGSSPDHPSN
jgi:hypothetical protein